MRKFLGVAVLLCVLAGCAPTSAQSSAEPTTTPPSQGNADDALAEYSDAVESWPQPLPHGNSYPSSPTGLTSGELYDEGFGTSIVAFYWRCAWMSSYLESVDSNDFSGQSESFEQLERWVDFPWVREHVVDDPDSSWDHTILQPARDGDPTAMRTFQRSC